MVLVTLTICAIPNKTSLTLALEVVPVRNTLSILVTTSCTIYARIQTCPKIYSKFNIINNHYLVLEFSHFSTGHEEKTCTPRFPLISICSVTWFFNNNMQHLTKISFMCKINRGSSCWSSVWGGRNLILACCMECNEFNSYKMLYNHKLEWVVYALVTLLQIIKRALTVFQSCLYGH